jgi:hypothetical protein
VPIGARSAERSNVLNLFARPLPEFSWSDTLLSVPVVIREIRDHITDYTYFAWVLGGVSTRDLQLRAAIHYNRQKLYIRRVYTHAEYDDWSEAMRKVKLKRNKRMKL